MIGRRVEVLADLGTVTIISCAGRTVAAHERCWARHQTITDPQHRAAAAALQARPRVGAPPPSGEVEQRALSDYDKAFGLAEEAVA